MSMQETLVQSPLKEDDNYLLDVLNVISKMNRKMYLENNPDFLSKYKSCGIEDFVFQFGQDFNPAPLPQKFEAHRGKLGNCFQNAIELVLQYPDELRYAEGYAFWHIPVHHGWAIDRDGNVIDNTWTEAGGFYRGVIFSPSQISKIILGRDIYCALDDWENDFPAFKQEEFSAEDLAAFYEPLAIARHSKTSKKKKRTT